MVTNMNRRKFLGSAVASGAFTLVPRHVLGGSGYIAPSNKITLAHIGMGRRDSANLEICSPIPGSRLWRCVTRTPTATTTWSGASTACETE